MRFALTGTVALWVALLGASGPARSATVAFSDRTVQAGLVHAPSMYSDMSTGGMFAGGSVADFNRDGWPDLFLIGGGSAADALFVNNGDGTFSNQAAGWGVAQLHRGRGSTAGDFNADGWPDLFVTSGGPVSGPDSVGMHRLYRNNGDGSFTDVASAAGVQQASPSNVVATGAAFGDFDLDGDLDLFVCTWSGMDGNRLFRNDGNESFTDVTTQAGIDQQFHGFSPRFVDMNGDRFPELLVAADFETSHYYVNNQDGTFTDATATSGTGLDENGMGTTVGDFNRDGKPDWYVTSIYAPPARVGNFVYINQGDDQFVDLPETAGAKDGGWGWGAEAVDFDHDGWVDLIETNGWTDQYENRPSYLFRNNGNSTFTNVQPASGFDHFGQGRSVLTLDYDRDGDMDVVITAFNESVTLLRNDLSGSDTNWIELRLDTSGDSALAPDGYGAKVSAVTGAGVQHVWLNGGSSYLGRSEPIAHFGLADAATVDLAVEWPDGSISTLDDVAVNQQLTLAPAIAGIPGEAAAAATPMLASFERTTGQIVVTYGLACDASGHSIHYGELSNVASYGYLGTACWLGNSGTASFDPVGTSDAFFVVVGDNGTLEGSYGKNSSDVERPEQVGDSACEFAQDLSAACTAP